MHNQDVSIVETSVRQLDTGLAVLHTAPAGDEVHSTAAQRASAAAESVAVVTNTATADPNHVAAMNNGASFSVGGNAVVAVDDATGQAWLTQELYDNPRRITIVTSVPSMAPFMSHHERLNHELWGGWNTKHPDRPEVPEESAGLLILS